MAKRKRDVLAGDLEALVPANPTTAALVDEARREHRRRLVSQQLSPAEREVADELLARVRRTMCPPSIADALGPPPGGGDPD